MNPARDVEPIDFLFTEHGRQDLACAALVRLTAGHRGRVSRSTAALATLVLDCFQNGLPVHWADEEQDLFPLLRWRASADDGIGPILDILKDEHEADRTCCQRLLGPLSSLTIGRRPHDWAASHARPAISPPSSDATSCGRTPPCSPSPAGASRARTPCTWPSECWRGALGRRQDRPERGRALMLAPGCGRYFS